MAADTSCFSCDPVIPVQTPSVVYSEMSSVFTFTSCLFSALLYVLYIPYSFTSLRRSAAGGHRQGYFVRSRLAVRKLMLIGLVTICSPKPVPQRHLPSRASLQEWSLFNSCISSQAGGQWRRKGHKGKQMQNREDLLNENLRVGPLIKVLNQLNIKYKPMQC